MKVKRQAFKKYKSSIRDESTALDAFEAGWTAGIEWAAENARTKNEWEGNTGSEYCDTVVDKESILKGLL